MSDLPLRPNLGRNIRYGLRGPTVDMSGMVFGYLTVVSAHHADAGGWRWSCLCRCGKTLVVLGTAMRQGHTTSCGCVSTARIVAFNTRHGQAGSIEYRTWNSIVSRCENSKNKSFARYGAAGVTICARWRSDFAHFLADMGNRPSDKSSIDRVDSASGYWCGKEECSDCGPMERKLNCRWATVTEQNRNKRSNIHISYHGETLTLAEWVSRLGMHRASVAERLERGWSPECAVSTPKGVRP